MAGKARCIPRLHCFGLKYKRYGWVTKAYDCGKICNAGGGQANIRRRPNQIGLCTENNNG
jgi:hypothetical protein